jgi:hypothetical protein
MTGMDKNEFKTDTKYYLLTLFPTAGGGIQPPIANVSKCSK